MNQFRAENPINPSDTVSKNKGIFIIFYPIFECPEGVGFYDQFMTNLWVEILADSKLHSDVNG